MVIRVCTPCRLAVWVIAISTAVACAPKPTASPELMALCSHLYDLWWTYDQDPVFFGLAEKSTAELALYNCHQGRYADGIKPLEALLRKGGFHDPDDKGA